MAAQKLNGGMLGYSNAVVEKVVKVDTICKCDQHLPACVSCDYCAFFGTVKQTHIRVKYAKTVLTQMYHK